MLLNQIFRCLILSYVTAGIGPNTVFTPPSSIHSNFKPKLAALLKDLIEPYYIIANWIAVYNAQKSIDVNIVTVK